MRVNVAGLASKENRRFFGKKLISGLISRATKQFRLRLVTIRGMHCDYEWFCW